MELPPIVGHQTIRRDLTRALGNGRLPQVLLVTGEPGVGRQRLGLWLAQLALCQARGEEACGTCQSCRLVQNLSHPDLHWFVPLPRPKAGDLDRQVEEVEGALGELMAARRSAPLYPAPDGMAMHGVATARLVQRVASLTTVLGGRRVILIGDADRLVPQEANPEAANALLKLLEEPPASLLLILTTTDPTRVLPTIRSRAVPIRLGRLTTGEIEAGLAAAAPNLDPAERGRRAELAEGSLGKALRGAALDEHRGTVVDLLVAAKQGGPVRFERILRQAPWQARGDFTALLDGLNLALGRAARSSVDRSVEVLEPLRSVSPPHRLLAAIERVDEAREAALGNVNPQLLLATLTADLAEALWA